MASALQSLTRILALVALIVAGIGTAQPAEAADAALDAPSIAVLGDGSCGFEDDQDQLVVCGREFLGGLADTSWLRMPEGQCSDLLEQLFAGQHCALEDPDCQRASPAVPMPPQPELQSSSSPVPTLVTRGDAGASNGARGWQRAGDDDVPSSSILSRLDRPPRAA